MSEKQDCVVPVDDLCPVDSKQLRQKQEETLEEITRIIGDDSPRTRKIGNKVVNEAPDCGVLFTGEYIIGKGSTAARMLCVEQSPAPDGGKLRYFQNNPLIISTFDRNFITWFIANFDELAEMLKTWLDIYDSEDICLADHKRLQETHYFLNSGYAVLMQYLTEIGVVTVQQAQELHHSFLELLTGLVEEQDERAKPISTGVAQETQDYLLVIQSTYRNGGFNIAGNADEFDKTLHDAVIHGGCLNVRREKFEQLFANDAYADDVVAVLEAQGALKRGTYRRTVQIYATGGKRFYAIPLNVL